MTTIIEELNELDKDTKFLRSHYAEILDKFNGQYVAIKHEDISGHDKELSRLKEELKGKGIDPALTLIEFIRDKRNLIS